MAVEVAIVADDLTGALDAAAPFVRAGRTATVVIEPGLLGSVDLMPEVLSVSTGTRDLSDEEAARQVGETVRRLAGHRPRLLFKKIDSTLRGHVAAETAAMLEASGLRRAVVCPAVPAQGRIVSDGRVLVRGVPLAEWLPAGDFEKLGRVGSLPLLFESVSQTNPGIDFAFPDASEPAHLDAIARSVAAAQGDVLAVGASGLAAAIAGSATKVCRPALGGPFLFVAGSRTRETAAQAEALSGMDGVATVAVGPTGEAAVDPAASTVLLVPGGRQMPPQATAGDVAGWLAAAAGRVMSQLRPATIVLTGGDTAVAVLRHIGCGVLEVLGEIEPGVPASAVRYAGRRLDVVTKAGGFGNEDLFIRIARGD